MPLSVVAWFSTIQATFFTRAYTEIITNVRPSVVISDWPATVTTRDLAEYADVPQPVNTQATLAVTIYIVMAALRTYLFTLLLAHRCLRCGHLIAPFSLPMSSEIPATIPASTTATISSNDQGPV
jgi:hypothetical protein